MEAKKSSSSAMPADVRAALSKDEKQNEVLSGEHNKIMRLGRVISFLGRREFNKISLSMHDLERKRLRDAARQEAHLTLSAAARNRSPDPQRTDPDAAVSPGYFQVDLALVHAQMPGPMFMRPLTAPASRKPQAPQLSPKGGVPALDLVAALPNSLPGPEELLRRFTIRERAEQEGEGGGSPARRLLPSRRSIARSASQLLLSIRTAASQAHTNSETSTSPMSLPSSPKVAAVQPIPALSPLSDLVITLVHKPSTPSTPEQPAPAATAPQLPTSFQPAHLTALLQAPPSSPRKPRDTRPVAPLPPTPLPDADPPPPQSPRSHPSFSASLPILSIPPSPLSPHDYQPQPSPLGPMSPSSLQAAAALRNRPHTTGRSLVRLLSSSGTPSPSPPTTPRASNIGAFPDGTSSHITIQRQLRPTPSPVSSSDDVRHGARTGGAHPSPSEHTVSSSVAAGAQEQAPKAAASVPRTMDRAASNAGGARGSAAAAAAMQPAAARDRARAQVDKVPKLLPAVPAPRVLELVFET